MNVYISDQIAREHADRLMADAAAARRARRARKSRRAASTTTSSAHRVARPYAAFRSWILAGQL